MGLESSGAARSADGVCGPKLGGWPPPAARMRALAPYICALLMSPLMLDALSTMVWTQLKKREEKKNKNKNKSTNNDKNGAEEKKHIAKEKQKRLEELREVLKEEDTKERKEKSYARPQSILR